MNHPSIAIAAFFVAAVALGTALFWHRGSAADAPSVPPVAAADSAALAERLSGLEAQITRLRDEVALPRVRQPAAPASRPSPDPDALKLEALTGRISELEGAIAKLESTVREARQAAAAGSPRAPIPNPADVAKEIDRWVQIGRDRSLSEKERLAALRALRGGRQTDGTDARLAVLADMIQLAESSQDASTRADVWRQLSHVTDWSLVAPLLHSLQNDASPEVREEAAETLADFLADSRVHGALTYAAENDQNQRVRSQASESLQGRRR